MIYLHQAMAGVLRYVVKQADRATLVVGSAWTTPMCWCGRLLSPTVSWIAQS